MRVSSTAVLMALATISAQAQTKSRVKSLSDSSPSTPPRIVYYADSVETSNFGVGDPVRVHVANLESAIAADTNFRKRVALYLNGYRLRDSSPSVDRAKGYLVFKPTVSDSSRDTWAALLGGRWSLHRDNVRLGVGDREIGESVAPAGKEQTVTLRIMPRTQFILAFLFILVLLVGMVILARRSDILRDAGDDPAGGRKRPYSLARVQLAVWFFVIFVSFIYIHLITWDVGSLNAQALALLGIGSATALVSRGIDQAKRTNAQDQLDSLRTQGAQTTAAVGQLQQQVIQAANVHAQADDPLQAAAASVAQTTASVTLAQKNAELDGLRQRAASVTAAMTPVASRHLLTDVLSDGHGISIHRFQMLAWTILLAFIFLGSVFQNLAMPEFNATTLALLGLSAGTYIGLKIPEPLV